MFCKTEKFYDTKGVVRSRRSTRDR